MQKKTTRHENETLESHVESPAREQRDIAETIVEISSLTPPHLCISSRCPCRTVLLYLYSLRVIQLLPKLNLIRKCCTKERSISLYLRICASCHRPPRLFGCVEMRKPSTEANCDPCHVFCGVDGRSENHAGLP